MGRGWGEAGHRRATRRGGASVTLPALGAVVGIRLASRTRTWNRGSSARQLVRVRSFPFWEQEQVRIALYLYRRTH